MTTYQYYINLNERGLFFADVRRESDGKTVYEIHGFDIFEDGYMVHPDDLSGLQSYLIDMSILPIKSELKRGN